MMKIAKKCIWLAIALLPLLSVVAYMAGNIGNTAGVEVIPMGTVKVQEVQEGAWVVTDPDTWGEYIITPLYGDGLVGGLYGAVARLAKGLTTVAGIPLSVPFMASMFMLCHIAMVELFSMLIDFILFVPRKCMELFH